MNFYMTYGGTNWGNIGYPGVYTSYDYGAVSHHTSYFILYVACLILPVVYVLGHSRNPSSIGQV
jgi:hypothetical protein